MEHIQFVGIEPNTLISEITHKVKTELLTDLEKIIKSNDTRYLTPNEVCKKFGITKPTIYEWKKRGILKAYKLGSKVFFKFEEIEKAMITQ